MGFFGFIKNVANKIVHAAKKVAGRASKVIVKVAKKGGEVVSGAAHTVGKVATTVYHDVGSAGKYIIDTEASIIKGAQNTLGGIGSSLALPLGIAAAVVGGAFVLTR